MPIKIYLNKISIFEISRGYFKRKIYYSLFISFHLKVFIPSKQFESVYIASKRIHKNICMQKKYKINFEIMKSKEC